MARTPNYGQQRADRNRAKQAKQDHRLPNMDYFKRLLQENRQWLDPPTYLR